MHTHIYIYIYSYIYIIDLNLYMLLSLVIYTEARDAAEQLVQCVIRIKGDYTRTKLVCIPIYV